MSIPSNLAGDPAITCAIAKLAAHPIYRSITSLDELRGFMAGHVFAVWDFMSLVKRLQQDITCVTLPWLPPRHEDAARLINDIVLCEESDIDQNGKPASHLTMYLNAMADIGADARAFSHFAKCIASGSTVDDALASAEIPDYIARFVLGNIKLAMSGTTVEVAANFLFGREDVIPQMFINLLGQWGLDETDAPTLVYYLKRHIELDGDEHGPSGHRLLAALIGSDPARHAQAKAAALDAIESRIAFWDGLLGALPKDHPQSLAGRKA